MQNKTWCIAAFLVLTILQNLPSSESSKTPSYYTAAVFEYAPFENCTSDPEQAKKILKSNADFFSKVATIAKSKGADILVFPEYGLYPECTKVQQTLFCERIPVQAEDKANPCVEAERFSKSPTLRAFSCMAKNNSMVIQVNMGEYLPCQGESGCPKSGHFQFNTNVVFDRDGTLIVHYRKEHLWNESNFDKPRVKQDPLFTVDFGTFVSSVCFDLLVERIIEEVKEEVDGITFSTFWENIMPVPTTVQYFESVAITLNTTILAACIQIPSQWALGSGIFSGPYGALAYTFDPDLLNKLVVARVPRRNHVLEEPKSSTTVILSNGTTYDWKSDGENVPKDGSEVIYQKFTHSHSSDMHYHVTNTENHTLHQLTLPSASIQECNNGMCCSLNYSSDAITESIYLFVFNNTEKTFYPNYWGEEICMLVRCDPYGGRECVSFPMWSKDVFHHLSITANFSTPFVYPSIVNDHFRLMPYSKWNFSSKKTTRGYHANIGFDSKKGQPLIAASLNGRTYREDPSSSFF